MSFQKEEKLNYPLIENILPHRRTMLLVNSLLTCDGPEGSVELTISENKPYWNHSGFQTHWLIEIMAQAVGAVYGFEAINKKVAGKKPNLGFLVGLDDFEVDVSIAINIGDQLVIDVKRMFDFYPLGIYDVIIRKKELPLAHARLKLAVAPEGFSLGDLSSSAS